MAIEEAAVLAELKIRNSLTAADEPKICSYIRQMKSKALTYCNLTELPDNLFYTLVDMVEQRIGIDNVESITRGDTNIKYRTPDEIVSGFRNELNKFRRIKTV